ncbi:MAG: CHAT domain-containing protein [Planctomycetota bacterium]
MLLLLACPDDQLRVRLDKEHREIEEKIRRSEHRDDIALECRQAVRPGDLSQALLDVNPDVVHFSGHGGVDSTVVVENELGVTQTIQPEAFVGLFELVAETVSCVIINACHSKSLAEHLGKHIEHVVGMADAIADDAAIAFAVGFYKALGAGKSFPEAFQFGKVEIGLCGLDGSDVPVLFTRPAMRPMEQEEQVSPTAESAALDTLARDEMDYILEIGNRLNKGQIIKSFVKWATGKTQMRFVEMMEGFVERGWVRDDLDPHNFVLSTAGWQVVEALREAYADRVATGKTAGPGPLPEIALDSVCKVTAVNPGSVFVLPAKTIAELSGTIATWVLIQDDGIREPTNHRYIWSHATNRGVQKEVGRDRRYVDVFALYHASTGVWRLWLADNRGDKYVRNIPDGPQLTGWHHFLVRWNRSVPLMQWVVDGNVVDESADFEQFWPKEFADSLVFGSWIRPTRDHYIETYLWRVASSASFVDDRWIKQELAKELPDVR